MGGGIGEKCHISKWRLVVQQPHCAQWNHSDLPPKRSQYGLGTLVNFMSTQSNRSHTLCDAGRVGVNAHCGASSTPAQWQHILLHQLARSVAVLFPDAEPAPASYDLYYRVVRHVKEFILLPPGGWSRRAMERVEVVGLESSSDLKDMLMT